MAAALALSAGAALGVTAALRRRCACAAAARWASATAAQPATPTLDHGVLVLDYANESAPTFNHNEVLFESCKQVAKKLTIWLRPGPTSLDQALLAKYMMALYDEAYTAACDVGKPMLQCTVVPGAALGGTVVAQELGVVAQAADAVLVDAADAKLVQWLPTAWSGQLVQVPTQDYSGVTVVEAASAPLPAHSFVAVGGTFDHMHAGHRKLLATAAAVTEAGNGHLYIGLTGPALLSKKKHAEVLQSFEEREGAVRGFLASVAPDLHLTVARLDDPGGAAATDPAFTAIVVSTETLSGAAWINNKRTAAGMPPLEVICIARRNNTLQSSTWLRQWTAKQGQ